MLFGSYMPAPTDKHGKITKLSKYIKDKDPVLKYPIIWAFPISRLKNAVIHSLFSAPGFPQVLFIFDTDEYMKIDKIKHYAMLKQQKDTGTAFSLRDIIADDIDEDHAEYILDASKCDRWIQQASAVSGIPAFLYGSMPLGKLLPGSGEWPPETEDAVRKAVSLVMPDYKSSMDAMKEANGLTEMTDEQEKAFGMKLLHQVFTISLFPLATQAALHGPSRAWYIFSALTNSYRLALYEQQFIHWTDEDCTKEGYDRIFYPALDYVIDNDDVLKAIAFNELPKDNEFCPCGSGKKYKKCHKPFIGA